MAFIGKRGTKRDCKTRDYWAHRSEVLLLQNPEFLILPDQYFASKFHLEEYVELAQKMMEIDQRIRIYRKEMVPNK